MFKVGDVVILRSGGYPMTVVSTCQGAISCAWSYEGDIKTEIFSFRVLDLYNPKKVLQTTK
jgi:uncharacterized protein YodC (DUF2158 family)